MISEDWQPDALGRFLLINDRRRASCSMSLPRLSRINRRRTRREDVKNRREESLWWGVSVLR